jgi:ABC-2 type transport system ATP-binding protein
MLAIEAHGLTRLFPPATRAVDGIDLAIESGTVFGFLGQNGSGKTTTVRMLTTLLPLTAGSAKVGGIDVVADGKRVRASIGVALQEAGLDLMQTGRELLVLQARLFGFARAEAQRRADQLLEVVDLADAGGRLIRTYSGGMQRRLDLAAALVHNPRIVFLDEPTTGLDPISREAIWRYIARLNQDQGVTVFLTTQYLEEADRLAHAVAIMDAGRIVAQGTPADLKASIGTDVVTVKPGTPGDAGAVLAALQALEGATDVRIADGAVTVYIPDGAQAIPQVVRVLDDAGLPVGGITLARPTLDDVFLRATGHHIQVDARADGQPTAAGAKR